MDLMKGYIYVQAIYHLSKFLISSQSLKEIFKKSIGSFFSDHFKRQQQSPTPWKQISLVIKAVLLHSKNKALQHWFVLWGLFDRYLVHAVLISRITSGECSSCWLFRLPPSTFMLTNVSKYTSSWAGVILWTNYTRHAETVSSQVSPALIIALSVTWLTCTKLLPPCHSVISPDACV